MANDTILNTGSGGDPINTTDCTTFTVISTDAKIPGGILFTSTALNVAPTAVIDTRPLPVCVRSSTGTTLGDATTPLQVSVANTAANATAIKVDGSAVTQPVSAASLPLPTGAATAAKQPALGTAGTASADVITVQGIASMTALKVDGSAVTQPVSGTFWQATQPVSAASLPLPTGASTSAKQPALGTAGTASADVITIQGIASMTKLLVTPDAGSTVQPVAGTASGASISAFNSAASNNLTAVKASAGNIYSIIAINTTATIYYLKLFDGTPTMGATNAIGNIPIPANTSAAGVVIPIPVGLSFATNISVALTGGIALNDNTNAATGVAVNIIYK